MPWFVQMFLHTLRIECNGTSRGSVSFHTIGWNVLTVSMGDSIYSPTYEQVTC